MDRPRVNNKSLAGLLILLAISLAGCYEPAANRTDEFENKEPERENADQPLANVADPSNTNSNEAVAEPDPRSDKEPMKTESNKPEGFRGNLSQHIGRHGHTIADIADEGNEVERRLLHEYGAVFLTKAKPPPKVMFTSEGEVSSFQSQAGVSRTSVGGISVELQSPASTALSAASSEARASGLSITPRDPQDSARRSYEHTYRLWNGRFTKACEHWRKKGKLTVEKIASLKALPIKQQVAEVLRLEQRGIYFSTNFDKSILYSVAAPGTSQHLSMLAFDAKEFANRRVRAIMAKHGWFRTVQSDAPHFTYLGYSESELPSLGLKKVTTGDGEFWIPDV